MATKNHTASCRPGDLCPDVYPRWHTLKLVRSGRVLAHSSSRPRSVCAPVLDRFSTSEISNLSMSLSPHFQHYSVILVLYHLSNGCLCMASDGTEHMTLNLRPHQQPPSAALNAYMRLDAQPAGFSSGYLRHRRSGTGILGACRMMKRLALAQCVRMYEPLDRPFGGRSAAQGVLNMLVLYNWSMLAASQKVFDDPPIPFMADFRSGLNRFTASPGTWLDGVGFGITVTAPTSSGLMHTKNAYGSLLQLVILCQRGSKLEEYDWEELRITLSGVMHPFAVDIISTRDFDENAEAIFQASIQTGAQASIQASIPNATIRLHTIYNRDGLWEAAKVVEKFWEQMDGAGANAAPAGL